MNFLKDTFMIVRAKFEGLTKHQKIAVVAGAIVLILLLL